MKCTVCGMENKQESIFCVNCGSKLEEPIKKKKPLYKKKWFWVLMSIATVIQLIIAISLANSDSQTPAMNPTQRPTQTQKPNEVKYKYSLTAISSAEIYQFDPETCDFSFHYKCNGCGRTWGDLPGIVSSLARQDVNMFGKYSGVIEQGNFSCPYGDCPLWNITQTPMFRWTYSQD